MILLFAPIFSIFALTFGRTYLLWAKKNACILDNDSDLSPEESIIIFDLHGVLFKHDYAKMIRTFAQSPQKWLLLRGIFSPCLIWDVLKLLYRRPIPESFFMHLAHTYKDIDKALPLLIRIANCQKRNEPMIAMAKELKQKGYALGIISNIGEHIFDDLAPEHTDLFDLFDTVTVASAESNYASKPNPTIYKLFLQNITDDTKKMVFIDDKQKNICGALTFNIIGIRFRSYDQCKKQLAQLGIDI